MKRTAMIAAAAMLAACGGDDAADAPQSDGLGEVLTGDVVAGDPLAGDDLAQAPDATAEPAPDAGVAPGDVQPLPDIAMDTSGDAAQRSRAESEAFLTRNAERPEVTLTTSGLQYEVLESGPADASSPTLQNWVCVHYSGALIDGTVFDSTDGGAPLALPLSGLIEGWRQALPLMAEGDSWRIFVPHELGYGASGAGNVIPPYAALVFDLTLERVLGPGDIAVLPNRQVDPDWNCAEEFPPDMDDAD